MPLFEFQSESIARIEPKTFAEIGLHERRDLQRLLREQIDVIAPGLFVVTEEFENWDDSKRRIDLLAIDKQANLVVIELKRTEDGGHMDLQALRYAAMISSMTFENAENEHQEYLARLGRPEVDARSALLNFLEWDDPAQASFGEDVRIILVSADFSKEITSTAIWLRDRGIDIRCVRLTPFKIAERVLVDAQQIVPVPEAADYLIHIGAKRLQERNARTSNADFTKFAVQFAGETRHSMWKRNAILFVAKGLVENGVAPASISSLFDWRPSRVWFEVEDSLDSLGFVEAAEIKAAQQGSGFNAERWFCENGELVHTGGRTFAFSNQWGGDNWRRAMTLLAEKFPQFGIAFSPEQGPNGPS
jgi:hypothetical protein